MADVSNTNALLNPSPAGPGGPGPTPAPGSTPAPTTQQQAAAELADLKVNADFTKRLMAGDADAKAKWADVHRRVHAQGGVVVNGENPIQSERILDHIASFADLTDGEIDDIRHQRPISPAVFKRVLQAKVQLFADEEWVRKYQSGDRGARRQMMLITALTCAPLSLEQAR
jgi:hypothetical protein